MTRILHDELMKLALQARFADFMRLFDPETAAALDLDMGVTFRDMETFTNIPQGDLLVSPEVGALIDATETEEELDVLLERAFRARTEDDLLHPAAS